MQRLLYPHMGRHVSSIFPRGHQVQTIGNLMECLISDDLLLHQSSLVQHGCAQPSSPSKMIRYRMHVWSKAGGPKLLNCDWTFGRLVVWPTTCRADSISRPSKTASSKSRPKDNRFLWVTIASVTNGMLDLLLARQPVLASHGNPFASRMRR